MYEAKVLASYGKHREAAERIEPALGSLDPSPRNRYLMYLSLSDQNEKLVEECKKIIKYDDIDLSWPAFMLGSSYEFGKGVEKDLLEAFRWYSEANEIDMNEGVINNDDVEKFLERHPEMKEHPEVQNYLNPFEDEEEY